MKMRTHEAAKAASTPTSAIPPQQSGLLPLWESGESDRSLPSSESWRRSRSSPTPIHSSSVGHSFGAMAIGSPSTPVLQRKLAIGQPNDQYEQEADRVADQVMRMPAPKIQRLCPECKEELQRQPIEEEKKKEEEETLQTKPLAESITPLIQRQTEPTEEEKKKKEEETLQTKPLAETITPLIQRQTEPTEEEKKKKEEETLQTKPASGEPSTVSPALQNQITALQGGGQPLSKSERHFFEPRFGTDFSQVRVHADGQAAEAARAVNARAFTLRRDIVFGAGEYQPRSAEGQRLLAHELTHVMQQNTNTIRRQIKQPEETEGEKGEAKSVTPSFFTESLKTKLAATVLAEAFSGQEDALRWIYYNNIVKVSGEKGLEKSSAYRGKSIWYKIWLYMLGDQTYQKGSVPKKDKKFKGFSTIKEFCEKNDYMKTVAAARAKKVKDAVDDMCKPSAKNPYFGWTGQGNIKDFNNESNKDIYWKKARAYYWLQQSKKVSNLYVKVLSAGENTQFIFNAEAIKKYFEKNDLPDEVPKYTLP